MESNGSMIPFAFALLLVQDKTETKGKSYAEILAMGRAKWHDLYVGKDGGVTAAETGAEGLYGDAVAWRIDRLNDPRAPRLLKVLQNVSNDAVGVGSAITGGGTMWSIVGASLYADLQTTRYAVLTGKGNAPKHVVSEVDRAYYRLEVHFGKSGPEPEFEKKGRAALDDLRRDLDALVREARRLPRRGSDSLLDFALRAMNVAKSESTNR